MEVNMEVWLSVLFIIAVLVVILYIVLMQLRIKQVKQANRILEEFKDENILAYTSAVNFVGEESKGNRQWRGNGFMILTSHFLLFERLAPLMRIRFQIRNINQVDMVTSYLGKRSTKPVLRLAYADENGKRDRMGFLLKNPEKWQQLIQTSSEQARKFI